MMYYYLGTLNFLIFKPNTKNGCILYHIKDSYLSQPEL